MAKVGRPKKIGSPVKTAPTAEEVSVAKVTKQLQDWKRVQAWDDIVEVMLKHYGRNIMVGDAAGTVAWEIMQDVRERLKISTD